MKHSEKLWIWLDDLISSTYSKDRDARYGFPIDMVLLLPVLLIWWVWGLFR